MAREQGDQLKTSVDQAAEGWVLGMLKASFPSDEFLAEERYDADAGWNQDASSYWTIDALDGTRSFIEGYAGFCVQVAFVAEGQPCLGVVCEPVRQQTYFGIAGAGAWKLGAHGTQKLGILSRGSDWPDQPRFVDSIRPRGAVGQLMDRLSARFVECGSVGLKICRVAEGEADVFAKTFRYKLWDVAPGSVILQEAGGRLGTWSEPAIAYTGGNIVQHSLLTTSDALWERAQRELSLASGTSGRG